MEDFVSRIRVMLEVRRIRAAESALSHVTQIFRVTSAPPNMTRIAGECPNLMTLWIRKLELPRRLNTQLRLEGGANYASEDVRGPEPRCTEKGKNMVSKFTKYGKSN